MKFLSAKSPGFLIKSFRTYLAVYWGPGVLSKILSNLSQKSLKIVKIAFSELSEHIKPWNLDVV